MRQYINRITAIDVTTKNFLHRGGAAAQFVHSHNYIDCLLQPVGHYIQNKTQCTQALNTRAFR